jgi:transposase
LYRFRSGWLAARTAHINTLRELGIVIPVGAEKVLPQVGALIEDADSGIPNALRPVLVAACEEIRSLNERIKLTQQQIEAIAEQTPVVKRLFSIPGIGAHPLHATHDAQALRTVSTRTAVPPHIPTGPTQQREP